MPSSNFTNLTLSSKEVHIGFNAMKIIAITVFILLPTGVLLLVVRRYSNVRKWNSSDNDTSNTHSIKYISDEQFNKIHINMNAKDALNCDKEQIDQFQRRSSESVNKIDANNDEDEYKLNKTCK